MKTNSVVTELGKMPKEVFDGNIIPLTAVFRVIEP